MKRWSVPIPFSTTVLLGLFWVNVNMAVLAEEFRKHGFGGLVLLAVNTVTEFVGASHCWMMLATPLRRKTRVIR
jgi:hypothetical protein